MASSVPADSLGPAAAAHTARALGVDIGAAFANARLGIRLPESTGSPATVCFDELFQVMTTLELPALNTSPAGEHSASLPLGSEGRVPPLLHNLLSSLQLAIQCTFAAGEHGARPTFVHQWRGDQCGGDTALDELARPAARDERQALFADEAFAEGVFYDEGTGVWRVQWLSGVSIAYPRSKPGAEEIRVSAIAQLRLDMAKLARSVAAEPPQFPTYYSTGAAHPYFSAADPLVVDVDVLSTLTDDVCIPDETVLERHKRIASNMCLLPLSSLMHGALGTTIVSPWSGAQDLAARMQRMREVEAAAAAADADIAVAPGSGVGVSAGAEAPREISLASALLMGHVVLSQTALAQIVAEPTLSVRIRTLHLPALAPISAPSATDYPVRSMLLSVELENAAAHVAFVVHGLEISIAAPHRAPGDMYDSGEIRPVVLRAAAPGHEAPELPATLAPHDQTNVLYTVHLDGVHDGDTERLADLDTWPAQRSVRVVMYGGPERRGASVPSCASSWNGVLDLAALRREWQWRLFSCAVTLDAASAPHSHVVPRAPLVAGDPSLAGARLGASGERSASQSPAPAPAPAAAAAAVYPWETGTQSAPVPRAQVPRQTLLTTVELSAEDGARRSSSRRVCIRVTVFNVSSHSMLVSISWGNPAPTALVADSSTVRIGRVVSGASQSTHVCVEALEEGMHDLGTLTVRDDLSGAACVLHDIGAIAAC